MTHKIYIVRSIFSRFVYIGSTSLSLKKRISLHRCNYKNKVLNKKHDNCAVNKIFEVDPDPEILLLRVTDSLLAKKYEQMYIDEYSTSPSYSVCNIRRACASTSF